MKFFVSKEIRENRPLVGMLSGMMVLMLAYAAGNFWLMGESIGLSARSVAANLLGSEERFTDPMELTTMVEMLHTALFIGPIAMMIVVSVVLRLSRNDRLNLWITVGIFAAFVTTYGSLFLIRFVSAGWIPVYQGSVVGYHLLMALTTLWVLYRLWFGGGSHGR